MCKQSFKKPDLRLSPPPKILVVVNFLFARQPFDFNSAALDDRESTFEKILQRKEAEFKIQVANGQRHFSNIG